MTANAAAVVTVRYDRYNVRVVTPPTTEQLTLTEAREHLRLVSYSSPAVYEDDLWLQANISAAREWCEWYTMAALAPQMLELGLKGFPAAASATSSTATTSSADQTMLPLDWDDGILLPYAAPLIRVDQIVYDDASGATVTVDPSTYYVDEFQRPARLYPLPGTSWPTAQSPNRRALRIRYLAGYDTPDVSPVVNPLPFAIRAAMLLMLGHLYENRENTSEGSIAEIPLGAASLLERYRVRLGMA